MKAAPNFRSSSWSAIARGQRALACKPANVIVAVSPAPACNKPEPPGSLLSDPFGQKVRELLSAACNDVPDAPRLLSRRCYSCCTALVQRLSSLLQLLHGIVAASAITSLLRLLHSRSSDEERLKTCQMLSCCSCCTALVQRLKMCHMLLVCYITSLLQLLHSNLTVEPDGAFACSRSKTLKLIETTCP